MARTLDIPEELMGETMRQVIAHEIGHALGLAAQHGRVVERSRSIRSARRRFTSKYGVSATIMDYARQNYVAQPGDGLKPKDFIRRLGPFDDFAINWGYRVIPGAKTADDERATLNNWLVNQTRLLPYRYVPQQYGGVDPRVADGRHRRRSGEGDGLRAARTCARSCRSSCRGRRARATTTTDLEEIYGETLGMWSTYMGHVTTVIGGVNVDLKSASRVANVYRDRAQGEAEGRARVPRRERVHDADVARANGHRVAHRPVRARHASGRRPDVAARHAAHSAGSPTAEQVDAANAYPLAEFLADLKADVWGTPGSGAAPTRIVACCSACTSSDSRSIINPPPAPAAGPRGAAAGRQGPPLRPPPFVAAPNVPRSDLPALARAQLRQIRDEAHRCAAECVAERGCTRALAGYRRSRRRCAGGEAEVGSS